MSFEGLRHRPAIHPWRAQGIQRGVDWLMTWMWPAGPAAQLAHLPEHWAGWVDYGCCEHPQMHLWQRIRQGLMARMPPWAAWRLPHG